MSNIPETLKYTKEHEWVRVEGDVAFIGITDYAQDALGDITYLELPDVGAALEADAVFGVVESVKTYSDLYAPIDGEVVAANGDIVDAPETINEDAYAAWLIQVKVADASQLEGLLDAAGYKALIEDEG